MLERYKNLIFIVVILAIGSGIVALLTYRPAPVVIKILPPPPTATPQPIRVYVVGAVTSPATYPLPVGSHLEDAIKAAGGAAPNADLKSVNLAQPLHDGDKITIPAVQVVAPGTPGAATSNTTGNTSDTNSTPDTSKSKAGGTIVHINSASLEALQALPGVGPSLAQKILDYRNTHGTFKTLDDLGNVAGIGPSKLKEWADLITFD